MTNKAFVSNNNALFDTYPTFQIQLTNYEDNHIDIILYWAWTR